MGRIHRVTFARQASNLWAMKKPMRGTVCKSVAREGAGLFLVDSLLVCPYGHDAVRKSFFYGSAKGRGVLALALRARCRNPQGALHHAG